MISHINCLFENNRFNILFYIYSKLKLKLFSNAANCITIPCSVKYNIVQLTVQANLNKFINNINLFCCKLNIFNLTIYLFIFIGYSFYDSR